MAKDINLDSREWLNLIFEGRNQSYGAYELRENSSNRHLLAIAVVIVAGFALLFLPKLVIPTKTAVVPAPLTTKQEVTVSAVEIPQKPESKPVVIVSAPAIPVISTVQFNNPTIVPDPQVAPTDGMITQEDLTASNATSGTHTIVGNATTGVHPIDAPPATDPATTDPAPYVDTMPVFDGNLNQWLSSNIRYPIDAIELGQEGKVVLRFVVETDGSIGNIQILRSLYPSLDREAVRVVKKMPKWKPGMQNGQTVRVYYTLPIHFRIQH
ncbi:MAG: energy transducer TonB [Dysgonamonadaceae bacterium]|jgi:protein TonB|nr:energy transducer TonB [Dysgonamonadaceae bacterium]